MLKQTRHDLNNDVFSMSKIKNKFLRKRGCQIFFAVSFLTLFFFLEILNSIYKGREGVLECLVSATYGIWICLYMFFFYRTPILRHIRSILEFNDELKEDHFIIHCKNLARNCFVVSMVWIGITLGNQFVNYLILPEYKEDNWKRYMDWTDSII
jgi:hypothetical protein